MKSAEGLLEEYGTPKAGIECGRCGDWGTVVIPVRGGTREEICPIDGCHAAERARELRGSR